MHDRKRRLRHVCVAAAVAAVALVVLGGAQATPDTAATLLTVSLNDIGDIGSVSAGQKLGYEASVVNSGPSTVSQVRFILDTALGTAAGVFQTSAVSGDGSPRCAEDINDGSKLICAAKQLAPGQSFAVNAVFSTSATAAADSVIKAKGTATVSAQTNGNPGNGGTSSWVSPEVSTALLAASERSKRTFSLPDETPSSGVELKTTIDLPAAFLNGYFGLVTEIDQHAGPALCDKCPTVFSKVSIPASLTDTNPFAASADTGGHGPYTFVLALNSAGQPPGYKPTGISHLGDGVGAVWEHVPLCSDVTLGADDPICLDGAPSKNKKTGVITATGRGIENGSYGWD
jgi:hypothetical protein